MSEDMEQYGAIDPTSEKERIIELTFENAQLEQKIQELSNQVGDLRIEKKELEINRQNLLVEKSEFESKYLKEKYEKEVWEKIVDEIAHSINTDVYVAVNTLQRLLPNEKASKAVHHIGQIRNITNLIMWYLKINELVLSDEMTELDLHSVLREQIDLVKEGVSTIRLSSDDHVEKIQVLNVPITTQGNVKIFATKDKIVDTIPLIIKDIVRNALKNTDEENPSVSCEVIGGDSDVTIIITNNLVIPNDYADWFNGTTSKEPENISKSSKVGLRVVKKWIDLLKIKATLTPFDKEGYTKTTLQIPREVRYEKN